MRNWQVFVSPWSPRIPTAHDLQEGEARKAEVDLNTLLDHYGADIDIKDGAPNVSWTSENTSVVSISNESTSDGEASAILTGANSGNSVVTMQATLDDNQIIEHKMLVRVRDRETMNP